MAPIYWTKHFCLILSWKCSNAFPVRGQKLAIVERTFDNEVPDEGQGYYHPWCKRKNIPYRIDTRSKLVKRIIKVWPEVRHGGRNYTWRRKRLLGHYRWGPEYVITSRTNHQLTRRDRIWVEGEAYVLVNKLERLWPLHCLAKEVKFEEFFQQPAKSAVAKPRKSAKACRKRSPSNAPKAQNSSDDSAEIGN